MRAFYRIEKYKDLLKICTKYWPGLGEKCRKFCLKNPTQILTQEHKYIKPKYRMFERQKNYWKVNYNFRVDDFGHSNPANLHVEFKIALYFNGVVNDPIRTQRVKCFSDLVNLSCNFRPNFSNSTFQWLFILKWTVKTFFLHLSFYSIPKNVNPTGCNRERRVANL